MVAEEKFVMAFISLVISLFIAVIFCAIIESVEWAEFSKEHNCVMTHKDADTYILQYNPYIKVYVTEVIEGTKYFQCNDGKTYTR